MKALSPFLLAGAISLVATGALAAPTATITRVNQTATQVQIKVVGSGFTRNFDHEIEVDQGGAYSGNLVTTYPVRADGSGKFNVTRWVASSCACLIGVHVIDKNTWFEATPKNLSVPAPCKKPNITVKYHNAESEATMVSGTSFTPNGSSSAETVDLTAGQDISLGDSLPVFSNGATGFHRHYDGTGRCGHILEFQMIDHMTDTLSNKAQFKLGRLVLGQCLQ
jgi:hypothetical protein